MNIAFTKKSSNQKVGTMPVTVSSKATCPTTCPLLDNGCYASAGFHTNLHWNKVTSGERGASLDSLCDDIRALKPDTIWRHNVSGDLAGADNAIDGPALYKLADANTGRRGFTYTHYPLSVGDNAAYIAGANRIGFTVNVSTNTVREALQVQRDTALPVVTIVGPEYWANGNRVDNVVRCPAESSDTITCKTCKLCSVSSRKDIVAFTVHGTASKKALDVIASDTGNV